MFYYLFILIVLNINNKDYKDLILIFLSKID
jgi:hypothetical protein